MVTVAGREAIAAALNQDLSVQCRLRHLSSWDQPPSVICLSRLIARITTNPFGLHTLEMLMIADI